MIKVKMFGTNKNKRRGPMKNIMNHMHTSGKKINLFSHFMKLPQMI